MREALPELVALAFPGDEKADGAAIAAGRGFFHINSNGGAEPRSFSPYSDANVGDMGVRGALNSPLFHALHDSGLLDDDHVGGLCVVWKSGNCLDRF